MTGLWTVFRNRRWFQFWLRRFLNHVKLRFWTESKQLLTYPAAIAGYYWPLFIDRKLSYSNSVERFHFQFLDTYNIVCLHDGFVAVEVIAILVFLKYSTLSMSRYVSSSFWHFWASALSSIASQCLFSSNYNAMLWTSHTSLEHGLQFALRQIA